MATRREFIEWSIAAAALPFADGTSPAETESGQGRVNASDRVWPLYRFLVDDRFQESVDAGHAAARRGATIHVMPGGDVTPFWFNNLSLQWRQTPLVVAGVTGHGPLFVLERFAWDYGMRVIVRAEHRRASNKSMAHELSGPDRWISRMAGLATSGDWTKSMGIALTQCTLDPCAPATLTLTEPSIFSGVENSDDVEPLLSWLIGPGSGLSKVPARG